MTICALWMHVMDEGRVNQIVLLLIVLGCGD